MKKRKKKYKSIITKRIIGSLHKIGMVFLVVIIFYSVIVMHGTNAGFLDEEKTSSAMAMSVLDAGIAYSGLFNVNGLVPGTDPAPAKDVTFSNTGTLNFKYGVKYLKTGGDAELCDALLLTAKRNGTKVYDKQLLKNFDMKNFSATDFAIAVSGNDSWNFVIELPDNAEKTLEKKTCRFSLDFMAWQTMNIDGLKGFTAKKTFGENIIQSGEWENAGDVVVNEIMWMGNDDGSSDNDEWLELRNMTSKEIDISGWRIINGGEGSGVNAHIQIPNGYSIKANGYFLITKEKWNETKIKLDEDLEKNEGMTNTSSMSLAQGGEALILQNKNKINIDVAWKDSAWPAGTNSTLSQSMERNNIPGDGTLSGSWHTCVSGDCNSNTYWDATAGKNYGTPGMPNLSPVVMNEIAANPESDGEQWVELYNMLDENFDVSGWYFKNGDGDKIIISEDNARGGKTTVPGKGMLVVDLGKNFLDKETDKISFYDDMKTPDDDDDDIREDVFEYEKSTKVAGDSFMRLPDGVGIWIDPEATPGEENKLEKKEKDGFQLLTYKKCFNGEKLKKDNDEEICAPAFLQYLEMIKDLDDKKIKDATLIDILEMIKEEKKKKLAELLKETEQMVGNSDVSAGSENPAVLSVSVEENTFDGASTVNMETAGNSEMPVPADAPETKADIGKDKSADADKPVAEKENNNSTDLNNEEQN